MPDIRIYTNSPYQKRDFVINFFYEYANSAKTAQLACPFFSSADPLKILTQAGCRRIQLLVRLCEATSPVALQIAKSLPDAQVRFFDDEAFHAKFYILGQNALVGSANLTGAGLKSNREIALLVKSEDEEFDELPALFDELWQAASVLTDDALARFKNWHREWQSPTLPPIPGIAHASPPTVNVATQVTPPTRTYLESFRRHYYEILIPSYRFVRDSYVQRGAKHSAFSSSPLDYEVDRFLSWTKLKFTTDETLENNPLRTGSDLERNILAHVEKWLAADASPDLDRVDRLSQLTNLFRDHEVLESASIEQLTEALRGCAAFTEQLRFTKGGEPVLLDLFKKDNDLDRLKRNFHHLAFDGGEFVQRTYDCIFSPELRLRHFGRNCILELFGWINHESVPPLNGRSIGALRYLGFDVR